jgi:hypothetical protein
MLIAPECQCSHYVLVKRCLPCAQAVPTPERTLSLSELERGAIAQDGIGGLGDPRFVMQNQAG